METQMKPEHKIELRWLILFALPTIFSNIFGNLYTAVDGIFVARSVDTDALSAINISMPMAYLASAVGMMFGTGGNALIAKKLGEGKRQEALEDFSLLMAVASETARHPVRRVWYDVPAQLYHRRQSRPWRFPFGFRRRFEYCAGLAVHGRIWLGIDRGCHRHRYRLCCPVCGRRYLILCKQKTGSICSPPEMASKDDH